jgi:hypothetical protein
MLEEVFQWISCISRLYKKGLLPPPTIFIMAHNKELKSVHFSSVPMETPLHPLVSDVPWEQKGSPSFEVPSGASSNLLYAGLKTYFKTKRGLQAWFILFQSLSFCGFG